MSSLWNLDLASARVTHRLTVLACAAALFAAAGCDPKSSGPRPDPDVGDTDDAGTTGEDGGTAGTGEEGGTAGIDDSPPECGEGDARACPSDPALVQFCGADGTFDACPCIAAAETCTPGAKREVECFPDDPTFEGLVYTEECVVIDCVPKWVDATIDVEDHPCNTPLALVPAGTTPQFLPADDRFFALAPSGCNTDWPTADTPWLARDIDGNGRIDGGHELFGSLTDVGGRTARHGFEALAALDANGDGLVDSRDPAFGELVLWADADGDRLARPGELLPLADVGIDAIPLSYRREPSCDGRGNCGVERVDLAGGAQIVDLYLACR